jgi:hypothetical protein
MKGILHFPSYFRPTLPSRVSSTTSNLSCAWCTHNPLPLSLNRKSSSIFFSAVFCLQLQMMENIKHIIFQYQRRIVEMPYVPKRSYGHSAVGITVVWTWFSSRSYSVTRTWVSSFWRKWAWFAARCSVTPPVVKWPGALIQQLRMALYGDVEGRLMGQNVLSRRPSGMAHGSSHRLYAPVVTSPFRRYLLYLTYNIVRRVPTHLIRQEHGFSSTTVTDWGMFCTDNARVYGRATLKRSAVLTRP